MGTITQLNILLVDDDKVMRNIVAAMITANDHIPLIADGYQQTLAMLKANKIDLILMTLKCPRLMVFR